MNEQQQERVMWDRVALMLVLVLALGLAVWWLETRFGSLIAVMSLGLFGGAFFFIWGATFAQRHTRIVLGGAADFVDRLSDTEKARQLTAREYARMEGYAAKAQLMATTIDAKRVDELARARARVMMSEPQAPASWAVVDEEEKRAGVRFVE